MTSIIFHFGNCTSSIRRWERRTFGRTSYYGARKPKRKVSARDMFTKEHMKGNNMSEVHAEWLTASNVEKNRCQQIADRWNNDVATNINPRQTIVNRPADRIKHDKYVQHVLEVRKQKRLEAIRADPANIDPSYIQTLDYKSASILNW